MSGAWLVDALVASALLMLAVLIVRAPVRRAFGAQVAYALWALPALRLALPPLPQGWHAAATPVSAGTAIGREAIVVLVAAPQATAAVVPALPIGTLIAGVWAAGAVLFLGWHIVRHLRFCGAVMAQATRIEAVDGATVVESAAAPGPLAFGVWRPHVAFPCDVAAHYDPQERALALAHELAHHRRGDLIANWAALVLLALHWFNPLAWRAFRAFRADQELACDAYVLTHHGPAQAHAYGRAIVKAAQGGAVSLACHLHTVTDLKGRLKMLNLSPKSRRRLATGGTAVSVLVAAGLMLTISGADAAAALTTRVGDAVGLAQTPPPPPAAPVPPAPPRPPVEGGHRSDHVEKIDGKIVRESHFASDKDGVSRGTVHSDGKAMAFVPVTSGDCGKDDGTRSFVVQKPGNPPTTVICTDRITQAAMAGALTEADGDAIEHKALTAALEGLRSARAGIVGNRDMTAEARAEALTGIDEGIKEVEDDLAHPGKDDDKS